MGSPQDGTALRVAINLLLGPLVFGLLYAGGADRISLGMSVVVVAMVVCFAVTLSGTGLPEDLASGLIPTIPHGGSEVALSLVATTAIPINLLLGSSLARSATLPTMRAGIALACVLSGLISLLIQLVGAQAQRSHSHDCVYELGRTTPHQPPALLVSRRRPTARSAPPSSASSTSLGFSSR